MNVSKPPDQLRRPAMPRLSPRQQQTLDRLMMGDSEKEAARALCISTGTLHVYVKAIYRAFGVNSRGQLLAACFRQVVEAAEKNGSGGRGVAQDRTGPTNRDRSCPDGRRV